MEIKCQVQPEMFHREKYAGGAECFFEASKATRKSVERARKNCFTGRN